MHFAKKVFYTLRSIMDHPLHRDHPWKAAARFCIVQVASRALDGEVCVPFPNQTRLLVPAKLKGAAHFISPALCEFEQMCFVTHFLRAGDLFVDVGAYIGAYSVLAGGVTGARCISFEPNPINFECLSRNIRLNDLGNRSRLLNVAVGNRRDGKVRMTPSLGTENYVCPETESTGTIEVQAARIDDCLGDEAPILMKMDIEGYEQAACEGAANTLTNQSLQAFIIERGDNGPRYHFDETKLHEQIRAYGFHPHDYDPFKRKLIRLSPEAKGNIIYVRDPVLASQRLRNADSFVFAERRI